MHFCTDMNGIPSSSENHQDLCSHNAQQVPLQGTHPGAYIDHQKRSAGKSLTKIHLTHASHVCQQMHTDSFTL